MLLFLNVIDKLLNFLIVFQFQCTSGDVLAAGDELNQVFEKYTSIIILGQSHKSSMTEISKANYNNGSSLLDLSSPTESGGSCDSALSTMQNTTLMDHCSDMDMLGDIFSVLEKPFKSDTNLLMPNTIMQPISISSVNKKSEHKSFVN